MMTHLVYLDVSRVVRDEAEARALAKEHNQLAYFDFGAGKSVRLEEKSFLRRWQSEIPTSLSQLLWRRVAARELAGQGDEGFKDPLVILGHAEKVEVCSGRHVANG